MLESIAVLTILTSIAGVKSIIHGIIDLLLTMLRVKLNFTLKGNLFSTNINARFQWQTDSAGTGFHNISGGTLYTGATNDTLLVNNVTVDNNQFFRCIVSLPFFCAHTSATASLIVNNATSVTLILAT